ncbi:MAG TPA: flagellar hook capping FlgD N-terminal domain-containing protein [Limnochordales bacterium]
MDVASLYGAVMRAVDPFAAAAAVTRAVKGSSAAAPAADPTTAGAQTGARDTTTGTSAELGKDDFLRLLVTQLRYQDPINPVKDQEFIAQLAQFSALEQMHNMATQMERLADAQWALGGLGQAVALLGRTVVFLDPETGAPVSGKVEAVRVEDGQPWLVVGQRRFSLEDVLEVRPEQGGK